MPKELQAKLEARAYEIWQAEGKPEGRHLEHWEQARQEQNTPEAAAKPPAAKRKVKDATTVKKLGTTKKPKTLTRDGP